jgi:DNA-binding NarL/FixJ family response regulator
MTCLAEDRPPGEDVAALAGRRAPAPLVIVDAALRIVAQSFDLDIAELQDRLRRLVERHVSRRGAAEHTTIDVLDATTALRVVDLAGDGGEYFAITFERGQQRRDAIDVIATEHRLTNREREVFRMLLGGSSDRDVSERLIIAQTTARDHAKNILRKTGANRRSELFAKVITYDARGAAPKVP